VAVAQLWIVRQREHTKYHHENISTSWGGSIIRLLFAWRIMDSPSMQFFQR